MRKDIHTYIHLRADPCVWNLARSYTHTHAAAAAAAANNNTQAKK